DRGQRCGRGWARIQVRRGRDLEVVLQPGREGQKRHKRRVRLGEAADQDNVVVRFTGVPDDGVAARAVGRGLVRGALADDPEAVRLVDVEQGVIVTADLGETGQVRGEAGHAVYAVHHDQLR